MARLGEILEDLNRSAHLDRQFVDAAPAFDIVPNRHLAAPSDARRPFALLVFTTRSELATGSGRGRLGGASSRAPGTLEHRERAPV